MDIEIIILSEVRQRKKSIIYHLYVESKKNDMNELICKTETDSRRTQTEGYQRGKGGGEGIN